MSEEASKTINIDGAQYHLDDLSGDARQAVLNIAATDGELKRLRVQVGIAQAARKAFGETLRAALAQSETPSEAEA